MEHEWLFKKQQQQTWITVIFWQTQRWNANVIHKEKQKHKKLKSIAV